MKTIGFYMAVFLIFSFLSTKSQEDKGITIPEDFYKHFKGKSIEIDKENNKTEVEIFLNLRRQGNKITGSYFNVVDESFYYLEGEFQGNTKYVLEQYDNNFMFIGIFEGVFISKNQSRGKWQSANDSRKFVYSVTEDYTNSVEFENYTDTSIYHIKQDPKNPKCVLNFDFLNPSKYKNMAVIPNVSNVIQTMFFGTFNVGGNLQQSIERKRRDLFTDYRGIVERQYNMTIKFKKKIPDSMKPMFNRYSKFTTSIYYNEDDLLCISKDSLEEAGGEPVYEGKSFYVFNMKNGQLINIDNLFFYPKYKERMNELFIEKIKKWLAIPSTKALIEQGYDKEFVKYNKNFYVDRYGLGFYFNAYEVNEKAVRVYFTWREISPYLKKESVISHLFPADIEFPERSLTADDIPPVKEPVVDEDGEVLMEDDDGFMPGIFLPGGEDAGEVTFPDDDESEEGGVVFPDDDDDGGDNEEGGVVFPDDGTN